MRESFTLSMLSHRSCWNSAYQNIKDVPGDVDLAFVSLPATGAFML